VGESFGQGGTNAQRRKAARAFTTYDGLQGAGGNASAGEKLLNGGKQAVLAPDAHGHHFDAGKTSVLPEGNGPGGG
jgi:hypothetical protein